MKLKPRLSLALLGLLAATAWTGAASSAMAHTTPLASVSQSPTRVVQFHGYVMGDQQCYGVLATVKGEPGTTCNVYLGFQGQEPVLIFGVVIPAGGTAKVGFSPKCWPHRTHYQRVSVWTVADAPVSARVRVL